MKGFMKILDWSTDKFIGVGLMLTLFLSILNGNDLNIQTNIISGLIGYMSKTVIDREPRKDVYK